MFAVIVRLTVRPEQTAEFIVGIEANSRASLADEPGCLRFDVLRDENDPCTFYFYEIYANRDAFEVGHRQAPHYAAWRRVVSACVIEGTQHNLYAVPVFPASFSGTAVRR